MTRLRCTLALAAGLALLAGPGRADDTKKSRLPKGPSDKGVKLIPDAWKTVAVKKLTPAEVDKLLADAQKNDKIKNAPLVSDDLFLRRAALDLIGRLPPASSMGAFLKDLRSDRRAKVIDKLLESDQY